MLVEELAPTQSDCFVAITNNYMFFEWISSEDDAVASAAITHTHATFKFFILIRTFGCATNPIS